MGRGDTTTEPLQDCNCTACAISCGLPARPEADGIRSPPRPAREPLPTRPRRKCRAFPLRCSGSPRLLRKLRADIIGILGQMLAELAKRRRHFLPIWDVRRKPHGVPSCATWQRPAPSTSCRLRSSRKPGMRPVLRPAGSSNASELGEPSLEGVPGLAGERIADHETALSSAAGLSGIRQRETAARSKSAGMR